MTKEQIQAIIDSIVDYLSSGIQHKKLTVGDKSFEFFDRSDALKELRYWESRLMALNTPGKRTTTIVSMY